ncbi:UPF0102 protein [Spirochaetia bacterium]|nr:UPF0102 protein [Spirochaetia bacterium]
MKNKSLDGKNGEDSAAAYLESAGFLIIDRNFRSKTGEIDIIALDHGTLVFVEVKAWKSYAIENLEYAIDFKKQRKIIETAKCFLLKHREYRETAVRFDVVFLRQDAVTHLAAAFMESV